MLSPVILGSMIHHVFLFQCGFSQSQDSRARQLKCPIAKRRETRRPVWLSRPLQTIAASERAAGRVWAELARHRIHCIFIGKSRQVWIHWIGSWEVQPRCFVVPRLSSPEFIILRSSLNVPGSLAVLSTCMVSGSAPGQCTTCSY